MLHIFCPLLTKNAIISCFPRNVNLMEVIANQQESYTETAPYPEWQEAMHFELEALHDNRTLTLTSLPADKKLIDCH